MMFKVGFFQFRPIHKKIEENLLLIEKYKEHIKEADLIVLPELATTGYVFENKAELLPLSEEIPKGKQSAFFKDLAKSANTLIITGMAERKGNKLYNAQVAFYPDGRVKVYRKIHLFYKEKTIFDIAYNEPMVIHYKDVNIGLMVCFDWAFPEHARILMLKGAHILAHSSNLVLPGMGQAGMRVRSIENRVFSITSNRYGEENSVRFTGLSQIVGPDGKILESAGESDEVVKIVDIDPSLAENKKITPLNDIKEDRRILLYKNLCIDDH